MVVSAMAGKTNELVALVQGSRLPLRQCRIRRRRRLGRTGDGGAAGAGAQGYGAQGALLGRVADSAHHRRRAWLGAHRRDRRNAAHRGVRGGRDRGRRRLSGPPQGHGPGDDARAGRLGHVGGGARRGDLGRPLRHLHRRRRRLHVRPAHRAEGAPARQGVVRGNAGNGFARGQGPAGAFGRTGDGEQGQALCALVVRRSGASGARHAHLRRGGDHGAGGCHRHRLLAGRGADHLARGRRQAGRGGRDLHAARRGQHQCRHDHPGRVRRRDDDRHHLHRARGRV